MSQEAQNELHTVLKKASGSAGTNLLPEQIRSWTLLHIDPDSPEYVVRAFEIEGSLRIPVLQQSIAAAQQRADILRSVFKNYLGVPLRVVRSTTRIALDVVDATGHSDDELEELLQNTARSEISARFTLDQQPLMRAVLVTRRDWNVLLVKASKLVADSRSIELWLAAVFESYQALTEGKAVAQWTGTPFSQFVARERAWSTSPECAEQIGYWEQRLGRDTGFELPPDRVRPKVKTHSCAVVSKTLSERQADALSALASDNQVPLEQLALAAFVNALARYTRRDEIVVGLTVDRRDPDTGSLIGPLENPLVLRTPFDARVGLVEAARAMDRLVQEACNHRRVSFQTIVDRVDPTRDLARTPLFQCTFESYDLRTPLVDTEAIKVRRRAYPIGTSVADFTMSVARGAAGVTLRVDFNTDLYRTQTFGTIIDYVHELLAAAADGRSRAGAGELLHTRAEMHAVPASATPAQHALHELFEIAAARAPAAVAATYRDEIVTYAQLNERANRLAALLICKGVASEDRVAICLDRSIETIVAVLAVLKAGAAYLMVDTDHPADRRLYVLRDSGARVLISVQAVAFALDGVERINLDAVTETLATLPNNNPHRPVHLDSLAYILYTSGSTGAPKGVMVSHRSAANNIEWRARTWTLGPTDRVLLSQSFTFDPSVWATFWPLSVGASVVVLPPGKLDVGGMLSLIDANGITVFGAVPTLASLVFEQANRGQCDSLRYVFSGGEVLPASLVGTVRDKSAAQLVNVYGPTETTIDVLRWECTDEDREDPVPIGRPIANTQVRILDENLLPVPTGFPGEICLSGVCLARGYWQRPALTAEKFMPDPYAGKPGARLYRTGDLGYRRPDGAIVFIGRVDEQVKVRGIRIELGEVELALCRHPSITEAAVTLVKDEEFGERLVAYLVSPPEATATAGAINQFLEDLLPQCMVPSVYMQLPSLPRNNNGKVIRKALPKPSAEAIRQSPQSPPQTPLQAEVQQEFVRALGIGDVGLYDDFFDLGGTSVMLARLAPRLATRFSIDLPVQELFHTPTVAGVSATIETFRREGRKALAGRVHMEQLLRDCQFEHDIDLTLPRGDFVKPRHILLTGATGYLGAFLLEQLLARTTATIHCLLRANDTPHGLERLRASMTRYQLWNEAFAERLVVVPGDLARPQLGLDATRWNELAESIDVIYHNGARVNFVYPYSKVREPNVEGTKTILRLASTTRLKAVHHISTIDVLQTVMRRPLREVEPPDHAIDEVPAGYTGSKWAAECAINAARKKGLPVAVYRPAQILGHTVTGATQTSDYLVIFVRGFLRMGILPVFPRIIDNVPVDYLAKAIVHISLKPASLGQFFNLFNPQPVSTAKIYEWLSDWGYEYEVVPYKEAQKIIPTIEPGHPLYSVLPLLLMEAPDPAPALDPAFIHEVDNSVECKNTLEMLADTDLVCPPVDEKYIRDSMQYLLNIGWLEPPDVMKRLLRRAQAVPRRVPTGNASGQAAAMR